MSRRRAPLDYRVDHVHHQAIAKAVIDHDPAAAVQAGMVHLSRLDETLERIKSSNANYFEQTSP